MWQKQKDGKKIQTWVGACAKWMYNWVGWAINQNRAVSQCHPAANQEATT